MIMQRHSNTEKAIATVVPFYQVLLFILYYFQTRVWVSVFCITSNAMEKSPTPKCVMRNLSDMESSLSKSKGLEMFLFIKLVEQ